MLAELVKTTTRDGLRLDGALFTPTVATEFGLDALVLLHGVGGNFYGGSLFDLLAPPLFELGISVLRVNTRGHDAISWAHSSDGQASKQGAAYELVDDCRHDIAAWVDFLVERGMARIGLLGHSLGAVKAIYAQSKQPHRAAHCVIAVSPPRLSHSAFQHGPRSSIFFQDLTTAQQHVEADQPETLLQANFPLPFLVSASSYVDKYGPGERYNILPLLSSLDCPLLVTYGECELEAGSMAFAGMHEAVASAGKDVTVATIENADHFYRDACDALAAELTGWLRQRLG